MDLDLVIILDTYQKPFADYATYQILVFSGTMISSILIQLVVANFKVFKLIKVGSLLSLSGLIISFMFSFNSKILCVFGIFVRISFDFFAIFSEFFNNDLPIDFSSNESCVLMV